MDISNLLQDKDYLALPETSKARVAETLLSKDKDFSALPDESKAKVLNRFVEGTRPKEEPKKEEQGLAQKLVAATYGSPTAVATREAMAHPIETVAKAGEEIKKLFDTSWQKEHLKGNISKFTEEEKKIAFDQAISWMPITETMGSLARMKNMMAHEKAPVPKAPTAEEIVKAHDTTQRLMKEDSSGSLIVDTQKFINEQHGIKTKDQAAKDNKTRRAEVKAAFSGDKEYADYLRYTADERTQLRTKWAQDQQATKEAEDAAHLQKMEEKLRGGPASFPEANVESSLSLKRTPEEEAIFEKRSKGPGPIDFNIEKPLTREQRIGQATRQAQKEAETFRRDMTLKRMGLSSGKEGGFASQQVMQRMAGASVGGITGAYLDPEHPISAALVGGLMGLGGVKTIETMPKALEAVKGAFKALKDTRFRIDNFTNLHDYHMKAAARSTMQAVSGIHDLVKEGHRREAIAHWMEGDRTVVLSQDEMKAATIAKQFFNDLDAQATKAGVYDQGRENYVTHLWDFNGKGKSATMDMLFGEQGGGGSKKFAKERTIPTIKEGIAKGLTPKTTDVASIMDIYSQSMFRAIENKNLIDTLKKTVIPTTGDKLLVPMQDKIPMGYKTLSGMPGFAVHPDVEGPLKILFENYQPNVITRTLLGLNMATKRIGVSYSLFHAKALTDAYIGAGGSMEELSKMPSGSSEMLKQLRSGGGGDLVDSALKGGLEISHPTVDVDPQLLHAMVDDAGKVVDSILPFKMGEKVAGGLKAIDKKLDTFMWERLHTGMKLEVFGKEYTAALTKNAEAHAKDPSVPLLDKDKVAQDVASYTNDLFGGLNWNRIANEAQTKVGRNVMMAMSAPSGKVGAQLLMFAPDWTLSTTRAAYKGLHPNNEMLTKLHRRYMVRSAIYYFTAAEALNQALSGHSVLDNKDPTRIDFGDGRTMQFSKHAMEPVHWATDTVKQAYNKLGFVPKELMEQKEMIQPDAGKRLAHVAKKLLPISAASSLDKDVSLQTLGEAGLSFLGMPVYGKTTEQKEDAKRSRREQTAERRRNKREAE